jgi:hypothetical protein
MPIASDKFSSLPNDLLCFILSKIPIREAVRCSVLSQRWRFLYTQIPQLTLSPYLLLGPVTPTLELTLSPYPVLGPVTPDPFFISKVDQIIFNILQWHSVDLKAFHLFNDTERTRDYPIDNQWQFSSQSVCKWVQYAADKNVQHLNLGYSPVPEILPPSLFSCTRLATLKLSNHILTAIPTHFSGFNHLITCFF